MTTSTTTPAALLLAQRRHSLRLLGAGALALGGCMAPKHSAHTPPPSPAVPAQPPPSSAAPSGSYAQRAAVMAQAADIAQRMALPLPYVAHAIAHADFLPSVTRLILPAGPGARRNWAAYRARMVEPVRIRAGLRFWRENAHALERAQQQFGVPARYIIGIIGIETLYARHMGNTRVIDALCTLAFDFPASHPRAAQRERFFRDELEQYLQLCWRNGFDPLALRGSYAGAMGMPQFMPSSWQRHAIDFDGDARIDLFESAADAIGSVAHYFVRHGWQSGLPPLLPVDFDEARLRLDELLTPDILPSFSPQSFAQRGAIVRNLPANFDGQLALIALENGAQPPSYWAGTENFYVITRYNHSAYYAKAVIDLAHAVEAART